MDETVVHDEDARMFKLEVGGDVVHLEYVLREGGKMDTTYTYTPPMLRGQGHAGRVVRAALEHARSEALRVVPSCWYVARWIARHPENEDLLA